MNHRNTLQRKIVLDTLRELKTHPTIDELHTKINENYPAVSKTTVYRNLRILAKDGKVRRVSLPDGLERYESEINPHYHFQCTICGSIFDVEIPCVSNLEDHVAQHYGFDVVGHDIAFRGICPKCK